MSRRIYKRDVHEVVTLLSHVMWKLGLLEDSEVILTQEGSGTYGNSWALHARKAGEWKHGRPLKVVDLAGAYTAREAYERIRAAYNALQYVYEMQKEMN